jgi:hypothetical protein
MVGWDRNANWNRDVLERIVALLFALANLAELAADAPFLRRRQVLEILSCGEAEAWAFVMGLPPGALAPTEAADDAAGLAARLRALALALCVLLARAALSALPGAAGPQAGLEKPARLAGRQAPPPVPDTS